MISKSFASAAFSAATANVGENEATALTAPMPMPFTNARRVTPVSAALDLLAIRFPPCALIFCCSGVSVKRTCCVSAADSVKD